VILYHFTSRENAALTLTDGYIEPNRWSFAEGPDWPDITWLTSNKHRFAHKGWTGDPELRHELTQVRFTVNVPNDHVERWRPWAQRHGMTPARCHEAALFAQPRWYVIDRPILATEWVDITHASNGARFAPRLISRAP
jgi:hypothetical protein